MSNDGGLTANRLENFRRENDASSNGSADRDSLTSSSRSTASTRSLGGADHTNSAPMTRRPAPNASQQNTSVGERSNDKAVRVDVNQDALGQTNDLNDQLLPSPTAKSSSSGRTVLLALVIVSFLLLCGVIVLLIVLLNSSESSSWVAILRGYLDGALKKYYFPCDDSSLVCIYEFDLNTSVAISFDGTENLTDSKGHPLTSPWIWNSSHGVGVHSLTTNQSLRVDNDPSRAFQIVVHERHKPAPSKHPHPSPSPSKPPSPAPMVQPPYCEVRIDGRLYTTYVYSRFPQSNDSVWRDCGNGLNYFNGGGTRPYQSIMRINCYNGAVSYVSGGQPIQENKLRLGFERFNVSFLDTIKGEIFSGCVFSPRPEEINIATVIYSSAHIKEENQNTYMIKQGSNYYGDGYVAIGSALSIVGAYDGVEVACITNESVLLAGGRQVIVSPEVMAQVGLKVGDSFSCFVPWPYPYSANGVNLSFTLAKPYWTEVSFPIHGYSCYISSDGLLIGVVDDRYVRSSMDPPMIPKNLDVLSGASVTMNCSRNGFCNALDSDSFSPNIKSYYYSRIPSASTIVHMSGDVIACGCRQKASDFYDVNFNLVPSARATGFYWYIYPGEIHWFKSCIKTQIVYDTDNIPSHIPVLSNTQVGFKLIDGGHVVCDQNNTVVAEGDLVSFNSSKSGVITNCTTVSRQEFLYHASYLFISTLAQPNATLSSQVGFFSRKRSAQSVAVEGRSIRSMVP